MEGLEAFSELSSLYYIPVSEAPLVIIGHCVQRPKLASEQELAVKWGLQPSIPVGSGAWNMWWVVHEAQSTVTPSIPAGPSAQQGDFDRLTHSSGAPFARAIEYPEHGPSTGQPLNHLQRPSFSASMLNVPASQAAGSDASWSLSLEEC